MRFLLLTLCLIPLLFSALAWSDPMFQQEAPPQGNMNRMTEAPSSPFDSSQHKFLPVDQAFQVYTWREGDRAWIGVKIHPGYYLYRQRIRLTPQNSNLELGKVTLPEGEPKQDKFMGKVQIYQDRLLFSVPITHRSDNAPTINLTYQGCAEAGLCYPPEHRTFALKPGTRPAALNASANTSPETPSTSISAPAHHLSLWQLGVLFVAGIGLVFTPCVLPMLPIVAALVVGQASTPRRSFWLSCCYVLGMVITYTIAGLLIGMLGAGLNLQARLESPWVVIPFAVFFVLLAILSLEWMHLPSFGIGNKASQLEERFRRMGPIGLVIAGGLSTLIVSPCLSAPLAGVLTYISTSGNALGGGLSLLMLSLGMGIPLILVCVFGSEILPKKGVWMEQVRNLCALVLLGVALWLASPWIPGLIVLLIAGVLILASGLALGGLQAKTPIPIKAIALTLMLWAACCIVGAAMGNVSVMKPLAFSHQRNEPISTNAHPATSAPSSAPEFKTVTTLAQLNEQLDEAAKNNQPLMLDLYADWCVSCKEMDANLFPNPQIASELSHFALVKFDLTSDNQDARTLLKRYSLFGPPGILFFKSHQENPHLRIQGAPTRQQLSTVLLEAQKNATSPK